MLSAIAARKAAQAAQLVTQPPTPQEVLDGPLHAEVVAASTSPKRKADVKAGREPKRRKTKERKSQSQRYFTQPPIATNFDTDAESSSAESSNGEEDVEVAGPNSMAKERAWSPSHPLGDTAPPTKPPWKPTFLPDIDSNVFRTASNDRNACVLIMQEGETAALHGTYALTVLRGSFSLMGAELRPSPRSHPTYAPKCSPIPVIECTGTLLDPMSSAALPENIGSGAVICLEDLHTGVQGLGRACKLFDSVFDTQQDEWIGLQTASLISQCTTGQHPFTIPHSWKDGLAALDVGVGAADTQSVPKVLIRGTKNAGKSSLARSTVNHLLRSHRRVAFLECDVGQAEFTPPGMVALNVLEQPIFGPPFSHQSTPHAAHFIGSTSPKHSPSHYIQCIHALVERYRLELQHAIDDDDGSSIIVPLVVNTMGWTKGLGADLARQVEEAVEPTHIFSFSSDTHAAPDLAQVIQMSPIPADAQSSRYSASDWRTLSILSYFYSHPKAAEGQHNLWDCSLPLLAQRPYVVETTKALDGVTLIGAGAEDVVPSEVGRVLNGAIVALVVSEEEDETRSSPGRPIPYTQGALPPEPFTSQCIGLALIRGVQPDNGTLQLLTPIPSSVLAATPPRHLVKGEIELPVWGFLDHREGSVKIPDDAIPFLSWSRGEGIGSERRRIRRNLMRRGQQ